MLAAGNESLARSVAIALDSADVALIDTTATAQGVIEKVAQGAVDCVVADKSVGANSSLELYELLGRKHRSPPAMVLLTEDTNPKSVLKAFRTGIGDYVTRDRDYANELRQAIRRAVERSSKARDIHDEIDYLAKLAKCDRLTGLPNRAFVEERLGNLVASSERHGGSFAVFKVDIDNFSQINDIYGHAIGDQALKAFGRRLMLTSRTSDTFGRYGGDEFLYLIDRVVSPETVSQVCERLVTALQFNVDLDAVGLSLSASIGAAIFPSDGASADTLIAAADRALRAARTRSRRYCLAQGAGEGLAGGAVLPPVPNGPSVPRAPAVEATAKRPPVVPAAGDDARDENRRIEHRNRVFKRGRIILGDGFSTMDCVIRDLSIRGARISLEDQVTLPQRFSFSVMENGATYPAVRRWQRGRSIGIEFKTAEARAEVPAEAAVAA